MTRYDAIADGPLFVSDAVSPCPGSGGFSEDGLVECKQHLCGGRTKPNYTTNKPNSSEGGPPWKEVRLASHPGEILKRRADLRLTQGQTCVSPAAGALRWHVLDVHARFAAMMPGSQTTKISPHLHTFLLGFYYNFNNYNFKNL